MTSYPTPDDQSDYPVPTHCSSTPERVFLYRNRWCWVYGPAWDPPAGVDLHLHYYRGYTTTSLTGEVHDYDIEVFGGVSFIDDGYIGFDTQHPYPERPMDADATAKEVERLVDEVIDVEGSL